MERSNWFYYGSDPQQQAAPYSPQAPSRAATDAAYDAQRLLGVYPMASATPSTHVARHLSNLAISAPPPSYTHPHYYNMHGPTYSQSHSQSYTSYSPEFDYLSALQAPADDSGYWENARNEAVRLLGNQTGSYHAPPASHWSQPSAPSTYQTSAFAQSVFQRTAPSVAYPTPPPANTTSYSSLAHALDPAPKASHRPPQKVYQPQESAAFFNNYIEKKTREIHGSSARMSTPRKKTPPSRPPPPMQSSPDPLAFLHSPPEVVITPKKRKAVDDSGVPSSKRIQSSQTSLSTLTPQTPTSSAPSQRSTSKLSSARTVYVEVPKLPKWYTPTNSQRKGSKASARLKKDDEEPDLGGYGSEDESDYQRRHDHLKSSSSRRTGDRDERAPLEKLTALIEDIFEAEDNLPPESDPPDLPAEFFSPMTVDTANPLVHPNVVRKLTKYIGNVARPTKRARGAVAGSGGTPRGRGRVRDVDSAILSRLLKILERTVRAGEDLDPFAVDSFSREKTLSPKKPKRPKNSQTKTPDGEEASSVQPTEGSSDMVEEPSYKDLTDLDLDKLTHLLDIARDSILAAECCIALLASDRLPKQLYAEELITGCLTTIKNQLVRIVYPFVEATSDLKHASPLLQHVVKPSSRDHRRQLGETFQALSAVLPRINCLISADLVMMSDSIIIQAVYIAIGPFFVIESGGDSDVKGKKENVVLSTLGNSAMRGLRLDALSLIRSIFANHEEQRSWIIEEILSSLIKLSDAKQKAGQFRLRDGRSIRTVSALLLQLVQTSAHHVRIETNRVEKARQQASTLRRQESSGEKLNEGTNEPFLDDRDHEELRVYLTGLESATKAAKTIVIFLTQRSGKGKTTKNSNEAEYRTIFDNLIADLLVVLFWPEWPAASLLLGIACKYMVSSLDDVKTVQNDSNVAKNIALDHLGVIAARIRSSVLKVKHAMSEGPKRNPLKPLEEMLADTNVPELNKLLAVHQDIISHLCKRASEDQAYDSARELTSVTWGQELAMALKQVNTWITDPEGEDMDVMVTRGTLKPFSRKLKEAMREVWKDHATDVFDVGTQEEVVRIDRLAEQIGTIQSLRNSFHPILNVILAALDAPPVFMRTKALRALGQIVTSDPSILAAPNVRRAIESHLLDSSPAVRDAAVELIGKYMIDTPEVAGDYYQKIADRIADTGLGVRKRVIKLLKSFYSVTEDNARRIDISTRLVLRMLDEDDTVKDLAMKTVEELWFQAGDHSAQTSKAKPQNVSSNNHDKAPLLLKVSVIMGVSANFKDRQSPLEDVLHKIMADKEGNDAETLHARYAEICETLIDGLVDASDLPGFTVINCVRTIYLFASSYPAILSGSMASTLLPYLKNATSPEEQATSDYLLKIFRSCIPHMPKTAAKFGQELQLALQPMILKPSTAGGITALQETVACMCAIVQHLTHDFARLINLLKSCNARLHQAVSRAIDQKMTSPEVKALSILIFITSLLGEHCDFDRLRTDNQAFATDLNTISKGSIVEHIYRCLLRLYKKYDDAGLRGRILQCLGFLFRAQPTLMTLETSASIMDTIFASPEEESHGRLMKIMQEFLLSEAAKHSAKEKESHKGKTKAQEVSMDELVGNTEGFADSGVSSAIVQRYLDPILRAALSQNPQLQAVATDVLSFTVKQGLAHPLQSFPVIVALETSPNTVLSSRANALHAILHGKHASLLNSRYIVSARASFDYQKNVSSGLVQGYRMQTIPTALLQRWYTLVREKRVPRQDFLRSLVKAFDVNSGLKSSQDDVDFTRYMAENFSTFDYKTQEEVLTVIKYLTGVLSTAGMQLVEVLSPSHLLQQLHAPSQPAQGQSAPAQAPPAQTDPVQSELAQTMESTSMSTATGADQPIAMDTADAHATPPRPVQPVTVSQLTLENIPLMRCSVIVGIVVLLKAHLKLLYSLSEDKCSKFVIGKKSAIGDRPATKRHERPISWDRMPFATAPLLTTQDIEVQKTTFLHVWNEDGMTAEPEDDLA